MHYFIQEIRHGDLSSLNCIWTKYLVCVLKVQVYCWFHFTPIHPISTTVSPLPRAKSTVSFILTVPCETILLYLCCLVMWHWGWWHVDTVLFISDCHVLDPSSRKHCLLGTLDWKGFSKSPYPTNCCCRELKVTWKTDQAPSWIAAAHFCLDNTKTWQFHWLVRKFLLVSIIQG